MAREWQYSQSFELVLTRARIFMWMVVWVIQLLPNVKFNEYITGSIIYFCSLSIPVKLSVPTWNACLAPPLNNT